jgi:hypothetical protein
MSAITDNNKAVMFLKLDGVEGDSEVKGFKGHFRLGQTAVFDEKSSYKDKSGTMISFTILTRKGADALYKAASNAKAFEGKITNTLSVDNDYEKTLEVELKKVRILTDVKIEAAGDQAIETPFRLFVLKLRYEPKRYDDDGDIIESDGRTVDHEENTVTS